MPSKNLDLIIKARDDASKTIRGLVRGGFTELNQAIEFAKKLLEGFKQAYNFVREGAELQMLDERFARLGGTMGVTKKTLQEVSDEIGGVKSQSELLRAGVDLMSLGLVDSEDSFKRLMKVSGELGFDMNQLVLTLTNQTTMRFDALGISVDGFKERVAALVATGMSAQDAFGEAFLEQAEAQVEKIGTAAGSAIGPFMGLEAAIDDSKTSTEKFLSTWKTGIDTLELVTGLLRDFTETNTADYLAQMYDASRPLFSNMIELADGTRIAVDEFANWVTEVETAGRVTDTWTTKIGDMGAAADDAATKIENLTSQQYYTKAAEAVIAGDYEAAKHFLDLATKAKSAEELLRSVQKALEDMDGQVSTAELKVLMPNFGSNLRSGYQHGGSFGVSGPAGVDKVPVGFMASAGETVTVTPRGEGGGSADVRQLVAEVRRLTNTLPIVMRDAVTRAQ